MTQTLLNVKISATSKLYFFNLCHIFKAITPSVNDIAASHFVTFKFPGNFLDGR